MSAKIKLLVVIAILLPSLLFGQEEEKMHIAILDLEPKAISPTTASMVSDLLRTELFNTGLFKVLERTEMDEVLREQEFQLSGCTETACAVEVGRILSVRKMLVGTIGKLGDRFIINARIIDVERAEMEFADKVKCQSEAELDVAVEEFAARLAARITGAPLPQRRRTQPRPPVRPEYQSPLRPKKKNVGTAVSLSLIPLYSGHYYVGNTGFGCLFSLLDTLQVLILLGTLIDLSEGYIKGITVIANLLATVPSIIDAISSGISANNYNKKHHLTLNLIPHPRKPKIALTYRF